jgi:hypothetical protein
MERPSPAPSSLSTVNNFQNRVTTNSLVVQTISRIQQKGILLVFVLAVISLASVIRSSRGYMPIEQFLTKAEVHNYIAMADRDASTSSCFLTELSTIAREQNQSTTKNPNAHFFPLHNNDSLNQKENVPVLCVPQKNGNRQFMALQHASIYGVPPTRNIQAMIHSSTDLSAKDIDRQHDIYFITRNPYTRILSLYLQKIAGACLGNATYGCMSKFIGISSETNFTEFVKKISSHEKTGGLCAIDHHLCRQTENCMTTTTAASRVFVLKLEDEGIWFPCFLQITRLNATVLMGDAWKDFTGGQACYYTGTGDCRDMLRTLSPDELQVTTDNVHATGASNLVQEHYNDEAAALVLSMYAGDFALLNYSTRLADAGK